MPAPLVYLDTNEKFFPSDLETHIKNTVPYVNLVPIDPVPAVSLANLDALNQLGNNGSNVFLTLKESVENNPDFLAGVQPDDSGKTNNAISCAVIANDHGDGIIDIFYMYFYSFDEGNTVLNQELGDHVGDWEHNMIRFRDGLPQAIWFSQHASGEAFSYEAVMKQGNRPVVYSAKGTHANYAIDGVHDHTIPGLNLGAGLIEDHTSKGKIWDPLKNSFFYTYDSKSNMMESVNNSPVAAMNFKGKWGDAEYPDGQHGQRSFFGFKKYVGGPTGPLSKELHRKEICPKNINPCLVRDTLGP